MVLRHVPMIQTTLAGTGEIDTTSVFVGALMGAGSHLVLDSFMHWDVRILAPFGDTNILFGLLEWDALNWMCLGAGVIGAGLLSYRDTYPNLIDGLKWTRVPRT